ncbi:hypothetical protein [Curtobacterium sp. 9128]|uniref:DUF7507 domain-containing protein n=1 Tax=Curtobacterium sp. 9128 TaxID=1793722 RepID=UPI001642533F|nr:hypothetical protein [Curtobacterium sp. 9128]
MKHKAPPGARRKGILLASGAIGLTTALLGTVAVSAATQPNQESGTEARPTSSTTADGTARDPELLLVEDFENGMGTTPKLITDYVGTDGRTYTADPFWVNASQCNGIVLSYTSSDMAGCGSGPSQQLKALANALGQVTGTPAETNHIVSAYTTSINPARGSVQLESVQPYQVDESGRFISFGVSAAAASCQVSSAAPPLLDFSLIDGTTEHKIADTPINPCTDRGSSSYTVGSIPVKAGQFVSKGGLLFTGDTVRWRMRNQQPTSNGNDGAVDRVSILDSTPTMTQTLTGTPIVGDTARMTYRVVNTTEHGQKPGWSFTADLPSGLTVAPTPNQSTTCASPEVAAAAGATSVSVGGGLAEGAVDCTVSVDVTTTTPGTYTADSGLVTTHTGLDLAGTSSVTFAPEQNALTVTGTPVITGGNGDAVADLGEQIAFRYDVKNDGNVAVHDLKIGESADSCAATDIAAGATVSCTTPTRAVTQDDVDAGSIDDSVSISAFSRLDVPVAGSGAATVSTSEQNAGAGLVLAPVVKTTGDPGVGDTVTLSVTASNTGNVTLRDTRIEIGGARGMTVTCPVSIAPGASVECDVAGSYEVTQADVDHGSVEFTATATSTSPKGVEVEAEARTTQTTVAQAPEVSASFSGTIAGKAPKAGDSVSFTGSVENTGNVTLHGLTATVPGFDGLTVAVTDDELAPGTSTAVTVSDHTLTQADMDAGTLTVPLHVAGVGPKDQQVEDDARADLQIEQRTALTAKFGASLDATATPKAGDTVSLTGTLKNSGTVTLSDITASMLGRSELSVDVPSGPLAPGSEVPVTIAAYPLAQDDIDDGLVSFTMRGESHGPKSQVANSEAGASLDLEQAAGAGLALAPVVKTTTDPGVGDKVSLGVTASNTGNVTVRNTTIVIDGDRGMTVTCPATIAPGKSVKCSVEGSYKVTQADVDRGSVTFDATATSTAPKGVEVKASAKATQATVAQVPAVSAKFSGTLSSKKAPKAGDAVSFTGSIRNSGNVTLHGVTAAVPGFDGLRVSVAEERLAPGASAAVSVSDYTLTQADVDAGALSVPMHVVAVGPKDQQAQDDAETELEFEQQATMSARFGAVLDAEGAPNAGDTVTLTGTLANTGTVTLADVQVSLPGHEDLAIEAPETIAPGTTAKLTIAGYPLSQTDVDSGTVRFSLAAAATGPNGQTTSADETADVTLLQEPQVQSVLSAHLAETDHGSAPRVGDEVVLSATVSNAGNVTLEGLESVVSDGDPEQVGDGTLAPDAEVVPELAPYVLTQQDIDRGTVGFDLTTAGTTPTGDSVSSGDHRDVSLESSASIDISGEYTASNSAETLRPGDVVTGSFRFANTGNRTLDRAEVEQQVGTRISCGTEALQPGQVESCETSYTVTEADVASGSLTFSAKAKGQYTVTEQADEATAARAATPAVAQKTVWVFSKEITKKFVVEAAPQELAFTGTNVVMIGLPVAIVVLLLGLVLLLAARNARRRRV